MLKKGQIVSITTWGDLGKEDIARNGLEAFMGMVSQIHPDCSHWWCDQTMPDLLLMVEFYYNRNEKQNFIGGYICRSQRRRNGIITFAEPSQKILIQPLSIENYTSVTIGSIDQSKVRESDVGRGPIDRRTAEVLMLIPKQPIPSIPREPTSANIPPRFVVSRKNVEWNLVRVIHNDDEMTMEFLKFATLRITTKMTKVVVKGLDDLRTK